MLFPFLFPIWEKFYVHQMFQRRKKKLLDKII